LALEFQIWTAVRPGKGDRAHNLDLLFQFERLEQCFIR
jgi:hypothetical protein